jgi:hypothetical protein
MLPKQRHLLAELDVDRTARLKLRRFAIVHSRKMPHRPDQVLT